MNFDDWDTVTERMREDGLTAMWNRFGFLVNSPSHWDRMNAHDWDLIPQPIRAMAYIQMVKHWSGYYQVGTRFGLPRGIVTNSMNAIVMAESCASGQGPSHGSVGAWEVRLVKSVLQDVVCDGKITEEARGGRVRVGQLSKGSGTSMVKSLNRPSGALSKLDADDAFIALLIAAMDASGHVSAEEAARAHNIIWSMRRFRHRSGDTVGRKIERMRTLVEKHGASPVIEAAARQDGTLGRTISQTARCRSWT